MGSIETLTDDETASIRESSSTTDKMTWSG
jgi:hypothetical protein